MTTIIGIIGAYMLYTAATALVEALLVKRID